MPAGQRGQWNSAQHTVHLVTCGGFVLWKMLRCTWRNNIGKTSSLQSKIALGFFLLLIVLGYCFLNGGTIQICLLYSFIFSSIYLLHSWKHTVYIQITNHMFHYIPKGFGERKILFYQQLNWKKWLTNIHRWSVFPAQENKGRKIIKCFTQKHIIQ